MQFYGKFRGSVENNLDPQQLGRVQVSVPSVFGDGRLSWAEVCAPYAGDGQGFFAVPPNGAQVWVEFVDGDPDFPVLAGGKWAAGEAPGNRLPQQKVLKTEAITILLDDTPGAGGLTIEVGSPAVSTPLKFTMTSSGIELSIGTSSVKLSQSSVSINNGALEVM